MTKKRVYHHMIPVPNLSAKLAHGAVVKSVDQVACQMQNIMLLAYRSKLFIKFNALFVQQITHTSTDLHLQRPTLHGMVAWYDSSSWDEQNNVWTDKSGNGNDGILIAGTPSRQTILGVHAITGDVSTGINFGSVIKANFTVCVKSKYNSGVKKRILQGRTSNWLFGHWGARSGVAFFGGWKTTKASVFTGPDGWIVMCANNANSAGEPLNILHAVRRRQNH